MKVALFCTKLPISTAGARPIFSHLHPVHPLNFVYLVQIAFSILFSSAPHTTTPLTKYILFHHIYERELDQFNRLSRAQIQSECIINDINSIYV